MVSVFLLSLKQRKLVLVEINLQNQIQLEPIGTGTIALHNEIIEELRKSKAAHR